MTVAAGPSRPLGATAAGRPEEPAERVLGGLGRLGLAGRTGFYLILTGLTVQIAALGGASRREADANGALELVSRYLVGKLAIGAVAGGFALFGVGRLLGAWRDTTVSGRRRVLTVVQGLFYLGLAYVPADFLAGNQQTGSAQQQKKTTAELFRFPAGRELVIAIGVILVLVCAQQIRGAQRREFLDGLDLTSAPAWIGRHVGRLGTIGLTARALVFLPIGLFLIVSGVEMDANHSYGTDTELLKLSGRAWGVALLAAVAAGLAAFTVYSSVEARYRRVVSAR